MADKEVITYSLRAGQKCSCPFYQDRAIFTDEVVTQGEQRVGRLVDDYLAFLRETGEATARTRPEYLLELLVMGVLWRAYGQDALALRGTAARLLGGLSDLRERSSRLKKPADFARGLFAFQLRPLHSLRSSRADPRSLSSADQLERLLRWMRAAGRLKQETRRLEFWHAFLARMPQERVRRKLSVISAYAAWFEERSLEALGSYTPNVESFLANTHPGYRWREDFILCGRNRVEYHLNMVGTEILNRALHADFLRAAKKVVLVPPCMRARADRSGSKDDGEPESRCKAVSTPFGARCMACTPGCRVHQLTRLGEKYGFAVFTLPDDLRVFSGASIPEEGRAQTGIVGISCVLTNIQGGWDVRDLGVPAQGLLLDYCGCSYHWHKDGIATDVDVHQLLEVMGIVNQSIREEGT